MYPERNNPYGLVQADRVPSHPVLDRNLTTEVVVVGAGVAGALCAHALAEAGVDVVVLEKRHPGMAGTAASTALLRGQPGDLLHGLKENIGATCAEIYCRACRKALDTLGEIVRRTELDVGYQRSPCLQYAPFKKDVAGLKREREAREELGFHTAWLDQEELRERYGVEAPGGFLHEEGAQINAYGLATGLLAREHGNLRVFDTTEVRVIHPKPDRVEAVTTAGCRIEARAMVLACGSESQRYFLSPVMEHVTTYAVATKPVDPARLWKNRAMIRESRTSNFYICTTGDNRLIVGGRNHPGRDPEKMDRAIPAKAVQLMDDAQKLLPDIKLHPDHAWGGIYAQARNAPALIGGVPELPNTHLVLGFGNNGVLFSQLGAEIVCGQITGKGHPLTNPYSFSR